MAKFAILVLAVVATATAKPFGLMGIGGIGQKTSHVSSHQIISPYMGYGLGYGLMGMEGLGMGAGGIGLGHTLTSHSVSHVVPQVGMGMMGMKGLGMMYPGGIGMGYGLGMHG